MSMWSIAEDRIRAKGSVVTSDCRIPDHKDVTFVENKPCWKHKNSTRRTRSVTRLTLASALHSALDCIALKYCINARI
jgi:hypothetical protein